MQIDLTIFSIFLFSFATITCKKCNSGQIQIIKKNSGQKLYHCKDCSYNFTEREFFDKNGNIAELTPNFNLTDIPKLFFNLIGSLTILLVILLFGFLIIYSLDFLVTSTKYGQLGALVAGFLLFSLVPIFYIQFMKNLFDNQEGLFSPSKIGFFKRFGYLLVAGIVGSFNLFLVGLMILFVPAATQDIINGPKIECMTFVKILEEQTSRGSSGARIYKNYVEFKKENGETKKLADLKLNYQKISTGKKICFDKFENLNIYSSDRLE